MTGIMELTALVAIFGALVALVAFWLAVLARLEAKQTREAYLSSLYQRDQDSWEAEVFGAQRVARLEEHLT